MPERSRGPLRTPDEVRDAVYLMTGDAAAKQSRFWLLLVLAAVIASAGVLTDSTATVIGAMIIAPLAAPIQSVAVGLAGGELRELLWSARLVLLAGLAVVAIGGCAPSCCMSSCRSTRTARSRVASRRR